MVRDSGLLFLGHPVYIHIYFQTGKLQMKSRSPKLTEFQQFNNWLQKNTAGNGNMQPEVQCNECRVVNNYSSTILLE